MRTSLLSPALLAGLLAGSGLLLPAAARAEDAPPPKETQFFEALDRDRDGKVTTDEFTAAGKDLAAFPLLDRNKDGAITPDELGLPADYKPAPRPAGKDGSGGQPGQPGGAGGKGSAGGGGGELRRRVKEMDTDQDGRITKEEWKGAPEGFAGLDRNQDGVIDAEELGAGMGGGKGGGKGGRAMDGELIKQRWAQMDANGDGKVAPEEYKGELPFERLDLDKDGFLTEIDLKGLMQAQGGQGGPGMPEPSPEQIAKQFADLDKDGSGKLEAAELPEPARERALKADEDGDGALSQEEFAKGMKKLRRAGGPGTMPGGPGAPGGGPGGPGGAGGGPELLRRFDHDRDGKVTRDQFPGSDEQFAKLDKNADGVLTADDFPAPPAPQPPPAGDKLAALDKDRDGRLCRPEWPGSDDEWRALDKNTDGWVTAEELGPK